ncbi:MAG: hypothetical protein V1886_02100 [archaeon]
MAVGISIRHLFHNEGYSYGCFWCYKLKPEKDFLEQIKTDEEEAKKVEVIRCPLCKEKIYAMDSAAHKREFHKSLLKID